MNIWSKLLLNIYIGNKIHSEQNKFFYKRKLDENDSDYYNNSFSDDIFRDLNMTSDLISDSSIIDIPTNKNYIAISMTLIQAQVKNDSFNFYFLSN